MGGLFTYYNRPEELNKELHYAARRGTYRWAKDSIKAGADVNTRNQDGQTPLIVATLREHIPIMEILVDKGADLNCWDANYETALHYAVRRSSRDTMEVLIEAGADVNAPNKYGQTPLMLAVFSENLENIEMLINYGAELDLYYGFNSETALNYAAKQMSGETLQLLIEKGADVNFGPQTALKTAVCCGHTNNVLTLIKAGADLSIRTQGRECLTAAFQLLLLSSKYKYVKILIKAGADVNVIMRKYIQSSLIYTAQRGNIECAKLLLNAGAVVNVRQADGYTALEFCLERHLRTPGKKDNEEAFILLLFAAGEKVRGTRFKFKRSHYETYCVYTPNFLLRMSQRSLRLTDMCRDRIRKHLMQLSNVNLFFRVRKLGLPVSLASFLVYNVSVEE